jgi:D-3-phosphoglycerate dehydrogenase / 2-oxoglutarate reductase
MADQPNVLVNLPEGFFRTPWLEDLWSRLGAMATITRASCNSDDEIRPYLAEADAVLMWSWPELTPELLADAPRLKFAGHINLGLGGAHAEMAAGLTISEARRGWSPAVAELALTLMLAGLRKTSAYHIDMRNGTESWDVLPDGLDVEERQLTGRRVGIVGLGGIGQRLSELLAPFHVDLRAYDPYMPEDAAAKLGARLTSMDELAAESEVIVLCAPNTQETLGILSAERIAALRPGTVLVNIGRTWLVDNDALLARLQEGDIIAMLDVFEREPLEADSPLRPLTNVFCTPHRGGGLPESILRILTWLVDDLEAHLAGKSGKHNLTTNDLHGLPG